MKKNYTAPEIIFVEIRENDIITTSGGPARTILVGGNVVTAKNQGSQDFSIYG